jgi:hypothetical protein
MAFLFKSKKNSQQATGGLPPATRNVHTSEGAPAGSGAVLNGSKDGVATSQTPTPTSASFNNSLNSVGSTNSPEQQQQRVRQRAESESQVGNPVLPTFGTTGR